MKKLLTIAAASLAFAAMAEYSAPQIGVTTITATAKNTIIPVAFKALSDGTSDITVTDLVKTNSLPDGTWLLAYNGTAYNSWQYSGGAWVSGIYSSESGNSAGELDATATVGSALWIVLPDANTYSTQVTIYGAYTTDITSSVAAGGNSAAVATLVANPLQSVATITVSPVSGDQIIIPGQEKIYSYRTNKSGTGNWRYDGATASLPSFNMGEGFWYVRAAGAEKTTISWAEASE